MVRSILSRQDLKGAQQAAVEQLDTHLAVTAGAGAGKTRALVGRYLHFIEQGWPVRSLVAITFTEKAAREMRSRIRREIEDWLLEQGADAPAVWQTAYIDLDSASIGTIHSLCADLLRLYPAEAEVDPRFDVIEENRAAMLRAQAIEAALAWAASDAAAEAVATPLFAAFKEGELRRALTTLVEQRLEAEPALGRRDPLVVWEAALKQCLAATLDRPEWLAALETLAGYHALKDDDRLEMARTAVLAQWDALQAARDRSDWDGTLAAASALRGATSLLGQQKNWATGELLAAREAMRALRDLYGEMLEKLVPKGGLSWALDQQAAELYPALGRLFDRALADYNGLKEAALGLDFDDLEQRAAQMLTSGRGPSVSERPHAILVDEFQDTNTRQRQIVYALAGLTPVGSGPTTPVDSTPAANLFIVGDAKQSIYGFRGADVTVFREVQTDLALAGGRALAFDLTFRAHAALVATTARLLAPLMGTADDPKRPYRVPFAPLSAYRPQARAGVTPPFVEFQIGLGDAAHGRRAAAAALAGRLIQLHAQESFKWEDMALLFRASSAFPIYEDALEAAGIPFVTVAGQGFYDRPEIRDVLNGLGAIADPSDDLALAGLLRSPAFALTDADLYHLRFPAGGSTPLPIYPALLADPTHAQAAQAITELHALSGRLPVAELLKAFLDQSHYRAILKTGNSSQRLSRNVDKLLADAHRSRLVAVGDFLEYVGTLRDIGAREGEAPAEVGGAVQLMTIHKAKGLEFPLVVIGDAAHAGGGGGSDSLALDPALGILSKLSADEARPVAWQMGSLSRAERDDAEDLRVLYVAATRAREKIIFNGHANVGAAKDGGARLKLAGWLAQVGQVLALDELWIDDSAAGPQRLALAPEWADVSVRLYPPVEITAEQSSQGAGAEVTEMAGTTAAGPGEAAPLEAEPTGRPGPLAASLVSLPAGAASGPTGHERVWRVVTDRRTAPAWVVGRLVHEALARWMFNLSAGGLDERLRPMALELGLTQPPAMRAALSETRRLLERFRADPLFDEMVQASERYQAVPWLAGDAEGTLDVLYRLPAGWTVADFKTDELRDDAVLARVLPKYRQQLAAYAGIAAQQLSLPARPRALLVFLNLKGAIRAVSVPQES